MKIKYTTVLYYIGMIILVIGFLFRIQHWPYGSELMYGGLSIVILSGIISVIQYNKKRKQQE